MSGRPLQPADLSKLSVSAPELAQVFVSLSSDIALVIDGQGVVLSVAQDPYAPMAAAADDWVGRPWVDTATAETRRKIERLLGDVSATGMGRRREVNHANGDQGEIPVAYTALRLGDQGPVLVVGRDLRTVSAIAQRFLSTQQEIERNYWRARQTESRHRLLLQVATDAVFTVDPHTLRILENNPAASVLLQGESWPLEGRPIDQQFEANSRPALGELLLQAREHGRPAEIQVRLAGSHLSVTLLALPLRTAEGLRLLLRARPAEPIVTDALPLEAALARLVEGTRDGILVTDARGHVLGANRAFVRMAQALDEDELRGRPLAEWLGQAEAEVAQLMQSVHERGIVQGRRLHLRDASRAMQEVEVTGMLLVDDDQECLGFILRPQSPAALSSPVATPLALGQAIEALTASLGRSPLSELTRRAERLARHHLVQRALDITTSDHAAALLLNISAAQLAHLKQELAQAEGPTQP